MPVSLLMAQNPELTDNPLFSGIIEEISEHSENEEITLDIIEDLTGLHNNPLNINKAGMEELRKLYFLSEFQLHSILQYRQEFGEFLSINELLLVPGIRMDVIRKMQLFICITDNGVIDPIKKGNYVRNDLIVRYKRKFEVPAGFTDKVDSMKTFRGSHCYFLARDELTIGYGIKTGILIEKDAGEPFFSGFNKTRPDHCSVYLEITREKILRKLIIGDFKTAYGQGLIAGGTFISRTSDAMIIPGTNSIRKRLSSSESGNLRGLAAELKTGKTVMSIFLSSVMRDARLNLSSIDTGSLSYFTTIYSSGLHRNDSENINRNTLRQSNAGINITHNFNQLSLGITGVYSLFDHYKEIAVYHSVVDPPEYRSNYFNLGMHYRLNKGKVIFFGECAFDYGYHIAIINGFITRPHPLVTISAVYRRYSTEYISFLSSSFGKSSSTSNEEGFYIGLNFYPFSFLNLSCYADHYSFPWLKQNIPQPSSGNDYFLNATFTMNRENNITLRWKTSCQQMKAGRQETGIDLTEQFCSVSRRFCYNYSINGSLNFETRYEQTGFRDKEKDEKGYYLGQKMIIKPAGKPYSFWLSYGLFDISDWRNRVYLYEHDVLYDFSIPALYRSGSRFSVMLKVNILRRCEVWCKYYLSYYDKNVERGSGVDQVNSATDSGIKVQLRLKSGGLAGIGKPTN